MGFVASAPWVGACIGNVVGGVLSDRLFCGRRKPVMIITAASTVLTMYGLMHSPAEPVTLALALVGTGILLNVGYSTYLAYPMGRVRKENVPFAVAIVNTLGALGSAFAPYMVGVILDKYDWNAAFTFLAGSSLAALVVVLLIAEPLPAER
jgi:sugar phosphate permease